MTNVVSDGASKECIECLEVIKSGATRCGKCQAYQQSWRNWLPTFGTVFAILAFVGSATTFVLATATDFFTRLTWKDEITVITFSMHGPLLLLNSGSGELFVEYVRVESAEVNYRASRLIGRIVGPGKFARIEEGKVGGSYKFVENVSVEKWREMKVRSVPNIKPIFFSDNSPQLATVRKHLGSALRTFDANCVIVIRSVVAPATTEIGFPCVGAFAKGN